MRARPLPPAIWISIGALILLVALAFVATADNVATRADAELVSWVAGRRTPFLADLGRAASFLGDILVVGPLAIVAGVVWAVRWGRERIALLPALALALAALTNPLVKLIVDRPRPALELAEVVESSTGFPSGHSAQSAAFWLGLAFLIGTRSAHPRRWLAAAVALTFICGLSRILLGVHSPTDLLGGWAMGLACVLLVREALRPRGQREPIDA